ncbi:uncharacterized protein LOC108919154 isoform X2 [Scleropages formosus]|uniref:uncharacterized protein LOC108919154 isoform X2 n=1 Tax=Scleropages formosus TaxID=113540 RepID=UPI0008783119|nr:uncharacterized protein LOC108919154 isoform X2 [Scleropages formosus]
MGIERIWALGLLLALVPWLCQCISVTFQHIQQPLHVILNETMVLEAHIQSPKEQIAHVTWEIRAESSTGLRKVTVAEFPGSNINSRITTGNNGATLRVLGFRREDCGIYTLTVTSQSRTSASADCIVQEYKAVHHVTVSINVSHTSLLCQEAWGTDPKFKWLHERTQMNEEVGKPSVDGHVLYLSSEPCGHFTCIVSNRLGQSSATYTAGDEEDT